MSDIPKKRRGGWIRWVVLGVLVVLLLVKWLIVDIYTVPQAGMVPTVSPGGRFLGLKHAYRDASQVKRGDVIIFWRQLPDGQKYQYVWRVVGLPGDRVEVAGDVVKVNGAGLPREKVRDEGTLTIYREHNGDAAYEVAYPSAGDDTVQPSVTLTVPAGEFFAMGDNRHAAQDSRYDGPVPFGQIVGRKL